jgi:hypothetical protein
MVHLSTQGKKKTPKANLERTRRNTAPLPAEQGLGTINVCQKREPQTTAERFSSTGD